MQKHVKTEELERSAKLHTDALLDEALAATFPASDPPSMIGVVDGVRADIPPHGKPKAAAAKK
ncbi:MAG: hypothetical protein K8F62_07340 [Pseudorhodoplanes sp.]|nr:hypothetical protein [Pseudorhodoplanes sp.]